MLDEPQNPVSEESSIPASPQEPMEEALVFAQDSTPADMPPKPLEYPGNADIPVSLNNPNPEPYFD